MWKSFFGDKKKDKEQEKVDSQKSLADAIANQREAISTLEKRQQLLEVKIQTTLEEAKTRAAANDKRGALLVLKRKKMLEQELETLMNSHLTLEQQIHSLEAAQTTQLAVTALQQGVKAQKNLNTNVKMEDVDELMDDMQEQQELQNEIAQVLSQGVRVTDDDELLAELEALQTCELEKNMAPAQPAATLPSLPSARVATNSSAQAAPAVATGGLTAEEQAELAALTGAQ